MLGKVIDFEGAKVRLKETFRNPEYDLFGNNCEHFARFVAFNQKYSSQILIGTRGLVATGFLAYHLFKTFKKA